MSFITTYCHIKNNAYSINGEATIFDQNEKGFSGLIVDIYRSLELKYPKFHKMDLLAKTAFIGSELIIQHNNLSTYKDDEIAQFFANSESSEYSDFKFQESIKNGNPSPSQFVYTLPNILMGEIALKNKWYGENLFLVLPNFNAKEIKEQIELLLLNTSKAVLCGWVDITKQEINAFFFVVENDKNKGEKLTEENLLNLYNN